MDRRAIFFVGAALVVAALVPATDQELRYVPIALSALYLVLALGSWLDFRSRARSD
jgi:hypothetical protein